MTAAAVSRVEVVRALERYQQQQYRFAARWPLGRLGLPLTTAAGRGTQAQQGCGVVFWPTSSTGP